MLDGHALTRLISAKRQRHGALEGSEAHRRGPGPASAPARDGSPPAAGHARCSEQVPSQASSHRSVSRSVGLHDGQAAVTGAWVPGCVRAGGRAAAAVAAHSGLVSGERTLQVPWPSRA